MIEALALRDPGRSSTPQGYQLPSASTPERRLPRGATNARIDILEVLRAEHGGYCESLFWRLAQLDPCGLTRLIRQGCLAPHDLTFAAEALGSIADEDLAAATLLPLLEQRVPGIVREGVIYGLARLTHRADARAGLQRVVDSDPDRVLREAAEDALASGR
jgi:hypothetical protein